MKALPCPSCGAPIAVKQGVASQKCSFCENVFQTDFATVPDFEGLDEKQYKKLKRRANDSLERNLLSKAYLQFSSLAELLETNIDEEYLDIRAKSYSLKLKEILHESYNTTDGTTIVSVQNEAKYANVSEPSYYYTRIDAPMIDLIDDIEDKCDSLGKEDSIFLARRSFKYIAIELENYLIKGTQFIFENASFSEYEEFNEFGSYTYYWAETGPVYLGIQIRCELYSMLMKYLEIIDIDEPKDNPLTSLEVLENANKYVIKDISLRHIQLNRRHGTYSYRAISDVKSVKEFLDAKQRLEEKLKPYFEEKEKIEKEEERKRKIEEDRIKEQQKAEAIQKAKEEKERREKWLASPEYKAQKKRQTKLILIGVISAALVSLVFIFMGKNSSKSNSKTSFNVEIDSQELLKASLRNDIYEFINNGKCFDFESDMDKKLIFGEEFSKYVSSSLNSEISTTQLRSVPFDKRVWKSCFGKSKVIDKGRLEDGSNQKYKTFFFKSNNSIVKVNTSKNLIEEFSFETK